MLYITSIELKYPEDLFFIINTIKQFSIKAGQDNQSATKYTTVISEISRRALSLKLNGSVNVYLKDENNVQNFVSEFNLDYKSNVKSVDEALNALDLDKFRSLTDQIVFEHKTNKHEINVLVYKVLPKDAVKIDRDIISIWQHQIKKSIQQSPLQEIKRDNYQLIKAYNTIKEKERSLQKAKDELEMAFKRIKEKNDELKNFAHVVSHDLKSPLNAIMMSAEMITTLYRESLPPDVAEIFDITVTSAEKMKNIINEYLHYATASGHKDHSEEVDLNSLVTEILEYVSKPKPVQIDVINLPVITFDRVAIKQVFQNLITNAIKYNDKEVIKICFDANLNDEGDKIIMSVKDNGPGIPSKYFNVIFTPYKTLGIKSNSESGTGLGLPLVRKIIERNRGKIWLDSEVGQWTTFYFSIPVSR
ncbi:sensor histidine kinase [Chondrinema litorale]|uniref:sensor histidine kinase n=1 Tax=Chondrinema litorale TaxID=2994555 RepID=UPI00254334F3|nr:HAMP domain-containing sensor histidine kinase [Chondrinema litorale]UZR98884.1 HAMP domain-containing sensor histidine kinase [Chondrinema litorale]